MSKTLAFSRFALFLVYFWFGILKVIGESAASPMVLGLLDSTLPFLEPGMFLIGFGAFEVLIGTLFLFPRVQNFALALLALHMVAVFLPLALLPALSWQGFLVPTIEGQYIVKNILIIALALNIATAKEN